MCVSATCGSLSLDEEGGPARVHAAVKQDYSDAPWRPWSICLPGEAHRRDLLNCQDATCTREGTFLRARTAIARGRYVVGVVSDGVGSQRYSEVGSRVTAILAANIATDAMHRGEDPAKLEVRLTRQLPAQLAKLTEVCRDAWVDCCYATLILAVGTVDWLAIWACGDGYYAVNGERPALTGVTLSDCLPVDYRRSARAREERRPMLTKLVELKASEVRGAWISTDGARYLTDDGRLLRDYLGEDMTNAPPVLSGRPAMDSWGRALIDAALGGRGCPLDDLGLVAFVPREM